MNENVNKFFELYASDEALHKRVKAAEAAYPGSLEMREGLTREVLLPIAAELGLDFTLDELRSYERALKKARSEMSDEDWLAQEGADEGYWLIDRGWTSDEAKFCGDK